MRYYTMELLQDLIITVIHCVLVDIKRTIGTSISELWSLLWKELMSLLKMEKFFTSMYILKASRILEFWLKELKLQTILYAGDLDNVLEPLLLNLNSGNCQQGKVIFECFVHLMAHAESNKVLIQKILTTPFAQQIEMPADIMNTRAKNEAKSLDVDTKIKCLEVLCEFGNGAIRLEILKMCIVSHQTDLAVGAVL